MAAGQEARLWIAEGEAQLAAIEEGRADLAARKGADRQRGREAWERANREHYAQQPARLAVAAAASWLWETPAPLAIW